MLLPPPPCPYSPLIPPTKWCSFSPSVLFPLICTQSGTNGTTRIATGRHDFLPDRNLDSFRRIPSTNVVLSLRTLERFLIPRGLPTYTAAVMSSLQLMSHSSSEFFPQEPLFSLQISPFFFLPHYPLVCVYLLLLLRACAVLGPSGGLLPKGTVGRGSLLLSNLQEREMKKHRTF